MSEIIESIHSITAEETYPLRHQILRPEQTLTDCMYPLDKAPASRHIGYFLNGELIGVGTIHREAQDGSTDRNVWRIRGMAVARNIQGRGVGGKILKGLISYAASQGLPGEIWCNGRTTVEGFYRRFGFVQAGAIFDVPFIGPHMLFRRQLKEEDISA